MTKQGGWPATSFAARLRQVREQAGLTQEALAEKAGCNRFTVAKLEQGLHEPAWPLVLALAKALGVDCCAFQADAGVEGDTTADPLDHVESVKRPRGRPRKTPAPEPEQQGEVEKPKKGRKRKQQDG